MNYRLATGGAVHKYRECIYRGLLRRWSLTDKPVNCTRCLARMRAKG